jgi:hypothetical protein
MPKKLECIAGDVSVGGTWVYKREGTYFLLTVMPHWNDEAGHEWYGYARLLHNPTAVADAIARGYGRVLGYVESDTGEQARDETYKVVKEYIKQRATDHLCPLPRKVRPVFSYTERKRLSESKKDSFGYLKGFLDGSRGRTQKSASQSYQTGFDHGVSYARGEAEPPTWLITRKEQ